MLNIKICIYKYQETEILHLWHQRLGRLDPSLRAALEGMG